MPENKHLKFLLTVAYLALGGAALWLALHFLLPWTLPFLLALLLTGTPGDFFYGPAAPAALGGSGAVHGSVAARSGRRALFVRLAALV